MAEAPYMPTGKHLRVLIVEDNAVTMRILARMLRDHYHVEGASGFDEALSMAAATRYDLFVLDIDLGERRTGVEVMHVLRGQQAYRKAPFVACTAYALPGLRDRFLEVGFSAYINKPFTKQQLLETLEEALAGRSASARVGQFQERVQIKLPPLPVTVPELMRLMQREEEIPNIEKLREIVAADPVATAWVLSRVNTAYYSLRHKISYIDRAVDYLGFNPVCNLVLVEVLSQTFAGIESSGAQRVYRHLLNASLATAAFARHLAHFLELPKSDIAFTGGIFSQVGRLALLGHDPAGYTQLWFPDGADPEKSTPQPPPMGLELIRYGYDYVSLGVRIAKQWRMPDDISAIVRYHSNPPPLRPQPLYHLVLAVAVGCCAAEELLSPAGPAASCRALDLLARASSTPPERLRRFLAGKEEDVQAFLAAVQH